jgi:hypothetical protein
VIEAAPLYSRLGFPGHRVVAHLGPSPSARRLKPLVQALCGEMSAAFAAEGMPCPPWRSAESVLSKWLPLRARDLDFASGSMHTSSLVPEHLLGASLSPTSPLSPRYTPHQAGSEPDLDSDCSGLSPDMGDWRALENAGTDRLPRRSRSLLSSELASPRGSPEAQRPVLADREALPPIRTVKLIGLRS